MLVCPPVVAVVCRLVDLRLLLNGGVLAALSSAALSREERGQFISHLYVKAQSCTRHTHIDTCIYVHLEYFNLFCFYPEID